MRVGIQPLTWGDNPFADTCKEISASGYEGVEPFVGNYLDNLSELKAILDANKLTATSTYTTLNLLDESKRAEEIASEVRIGQALRELGADTIVVSSPGRQVERNVSHDPSLIRKYSDLVNEACRAIYEQSGVKAAFHNHIQTLIERPEEIDFFMEYTDPQYLYAGFDTAQLSAAGADAVEYFERYKDRIRYVHLKDRQIGRPTYGNFCELGLGFIDVAACIDVLRGAGYDGWLIVEVDQSLTTPIGSATVCREYLRQRCGL